MTTLSRENFVKLDVLQLLILVTMGGLQSCVVASLTVCSVYVVYVHLYSSHKLLKTSVLKHDRLPSFAYLYVKYLTKALTRRKGCLYARNTRDVVYTIVGCR